MTWAVAAAARWRGGRAGSRGGEHRIKSKWRGTSAAGAAPAARLSHCLAAAGSADQTRRAQAQVLPPVAPAASARRAAAAPAAECCCRRRCWWRRCPAAPVCGQTEACPGACWLQRTHQLLQLARGPRHPPDLLSLLPQLPLLPPLTPVRAGCPGCGNCRHGCCPRGSGQRAQSCKAGEGQEGALVGRCGSRAVSLLHDRTVRPHAPLHACTLAAHLTMLRRSDTPGLLPEAARGCAGYSPALPKCPGSRSSCTHRGKAVGGAGQAAGLGTGAPRWQAYEAGRSGRACPLDSTLHHRTPTSSPAYGRTSTPLPPLVGSPVVSAELPLCLDGGGTICTSPHGGDVTAPASAAAAASAAACTRCCLPSCPQRGGMAPQNTSAQLPAQPRLYGLPRSAAVRGKWEGGGRTSACRPPRRSSYLQTRRAPAAVACACPGLGLLKRAPNMAAHTSPPHLHTRAAPE